MWSLQALISVEMQIHILKGCQVTFAIDFTPRLIQFASVNCSVDNLKRLISHDIKLTGVQIYGGNDRPYMRIHIGEHII